MRNVSYADGVILTADGCVESIGTLTEDACCPIDVCELDSCALMCAFINLLPNGPLWDRAKATALARYQSGICLPLDPSCGTLTPSCASVVDYAAYSGYRMYTLAQGPLWGAMRESDVYTAVDTLDSWLELYGWQNCWETICRDQRLGSSPLDCIAQQSIDACDANFAPVYVPQLPQGLDNAVRRGVAIAMSRLQMSPIKNLCGINWIIEPLGAKLTPYNVPIDHNCSAGDLQWEICVTDGMIESAPGLACSKQGTRRIAASFTMPALSFDLDTGTCQPKGPGTLTIWPALMAAQCIALSLIPGKYCRTPIVRCDPVV